MRIIQIKTYSGKTLEVEYNYQEARYKGSYCQPPDPDELDLIEVRLPNSVNPKKNIIKLIKTQEIYETIQEKIYGTYRND